MISTVLARTRKAWGAALTTGIVNFILVAFALENLSPDQVEAIHTVVGLSLDVVMIAIPAVFGGLPALVTGVIAYFLRNRKE